MSLQRLAPGSQRFGARRLTAEADCRRLPRSTRSNAYDMAETTEERKQLREGLLDQLGHLVREADMLEGAVGRVPEKLLSEAPPGEARSIKEIFGLIARLDEAVHARRIERIVAAADGASPPRLAPADPEALLAESDWSTFPITEVLERVCAARDGLIGALKAVPPEDWLHTGRFPEEETDEDVPQERDLYWMAHAICLRDRARLEAMTRRLYESHMGPAPESEAGAREREKTDA